MQALGSISYPSPPSESGSEAAGVKTKPHSLTPEEGGGEEKNFTAHIPFLEHRTQRHHQMESSPLSRSPFAVVVVVVVVVVRVCVCLFGKDHRGENGELKNLKCC